jgi:hypothetical protein
MAGCESSWWSWTDSIRIYASTPSGTFGMGVAFIPLAYGARVRVAECVPERVPVMNFFFMHAPFPSTSSLDALFYARIKVADQPYVPRHAPIRPQVTLTR